MCLKLLKNYGFSEEEAEGLLMVEVYGLKNHLVNNSSISLSHNIRETNSLIESNLRSYFNTLCDNYYKNLLINYYRDRNTLSDKYTYGQ